MPPTLPSPNEFPQSPIVIYDGNCKFCRAQVQRLHRWDGRNRLTYLSLHHPTIPEFTLLDREALMTQMYLIERSGKTHGGASAIRFISRRLPKLWIIAPLLHLPFSLPLWNWLYQKVAAIRYRISGTTSSCNDKSCEVHLQKKWTKQERINKHENSLPLSGRTNG